jgi:hypothetical protein
LWSKYSRLHGNTSEARESSHDSNPLFKRRRRKVKVDPKLGGQWKVKEKVPVLGGQWKVKEKVPHAWWPMEGERKILFTSLHFPPNQI